MTSRVSIYDADFSIKTASFEELQKIAVDARTQHLSATWSSLDAMSAQLDPQQKALVCPLFRNGTYVEEVASYRCHIWFVEQERSRGIVSLVDIGRELFESLPEVTDPVKLRGVVRFLLDSHPLTALA